MPITLSVHTYRNAAPPHALARRFDRLAAMPVEIRRAGPYRR